MNIIMVSCIIFTNLVFEGVQYMDDYSIMVVDDTETNIDLLLDTLGDEYDVRVATDGVLALKYIFDEQPDLILLDIMMPKMDGYQVCESLKQDKITKDIPIIFLTAMNDDDDEAKGLLLGAADYITKPFNPSLVKARVRNQLILKRQKDELAKQNEILEERVIERTQQLEELQDVIMVAMGALAESRDPETGNHIRRTQRYVKLLAIQLKHHPRFRDFLIPERITALYKSSPLHDIGKVGVPDHILLKPGKLTEEEFNEMKLHTVYGRDAIVAAAGTISKGDDFLILAKEMAYSHQEKWDGSGYPEGLAGENIPISARLMALADVYDALISRRIYKPPFPHKKAVEIITNGRGSHFDPDIVDAFLEISDKFYITAQEFTDIEAESKGIFNKL